MDVVVVDDDDVVGLDPDPYHDSVSDVIVCVNVLGVVYVLDADYVVGLNLDPYHTIVM